jgi:hypothetical protein
MPEENTEVYWIIFIGDLWIFIHCHMHGIIDSIGKI